MNLPKGVFKYNSSIAKFLLGKNYHTIMLFGFVFTKLDTLPSKIRIHEQTHIAQYQDCIGIGFMFDIIALFTLFAFDVREYWMYSFIVLPFVLFYLIYGLEWLYFKLIKGLSCKDAYLNIGFERQARHCASTWDKPCEEQNFYGSFDWWKKLD